jgi:hypothetical protein
MAQKNYVDALIVSVNKLFEKTAVKTLKTDQTEYANDLQLHEEDKILGISIIHP